MPSFLGKKQNGATLIEVLVSLFTVAVGLLGVLGLQVNAMGSNQRAEDMTKAQIIADDIVNRIMVYGANDQGADGGEFVVNTSAALSDPACVATGCTPDQQVAHDVYQWQQLITHDRKGLPSGVGIITWVDPVYTITVLWDQDKTGATATTCDSRNTTTHLTCFRTELRL